MGDRGRKIYQSILVFIFIIVFIAVNNMGKSEAGNNTPEETNILNNESVNQNEDYSISFMSTSELKDLPWSDEFTFNIVKINDMPEEKLELQDKINLELQSAMTSWIKGKALNADEVNLSITCHSPKYLSFVNSFMYVSNRRDAIDDYVTVDLSTGQRVFLSDLVEVGPDFVEYLQNNIDIIKDPPNPFWQGPHAIEKYSPSELLEKIKECSLTQEQVAEKGFFTIEESIGELVLRNSFFLREGTLVITFGVYSGNEMVTLDVDDIEQFLKVEKW